MTVYTAEGLQVWPGDFAAVRTNGGVSDLIQLGEEAVLLLSRQYRDKRKKIGKWTHAVFYAGGPDDLILEAEPSGAKLIPNHYDPADMMWSTGKKSLDLTPAQRANAMDVAEKYKGTKYSFLDYDAIALHALGSDASLLEDYIKSTGHMICSQCTDQCRNDLGSHLFYNRWPGFVDPLDLALLIRRSA